MKPVVIASSNGHRHKNGGDLTCVEKAFQLLADGADVLDAVIAGVNIVELDPAETSVGYGSLPNADGILQLDASCAHGPTKRSGAVAALEGVRTPSLVAKAVMEKTDHHLIAGPGAQRFAREMGFEIEADLNSAESKKLWQEWRRRLGDPSKMTPQERAQRSNEITAEMVREGLIEVMHVRGSTINCNGINARGEIAGVTTTSGTAWKLPGRIGDSPLLGAGLYVDGEIGAAGSTGRGEANIYSVSSFLIVEALRRGLHPKDAGLEACRRIQANTIEPRLLNGRGEPNFNVNFYILNARGDYAGVALYPESTFAVCTEAGAQILPSEHLLDGKASD